MLGARTVRFHELGLALLTLALIVIGVLSARQQATFHPPSDGVRWATTPTGLRAAAVTPYGPAARAGIRTGDLLVGINGAAVATPRAWARAVYAAGAGAREQYALWRGGALVLASVRLAATAGHWPRRALEDLVGFLYLVMGLFIVLRRRAAPRATLFFLFCLASYVLYAFHFTGKLNSFDWTVFWSNEAALLLAPALFLHFALVFPAPKGALRRIPGLAALLYAPAAAFLLLQIGFAGGALVSALPAVLLQGWLDRIPYALFALCFLLGTVAFYHSQRTARATALRQQLKWITRGATVALIPFLALYVGPYLGGMDVPRWSTLSVLSLVLIPLTFGYAIIRYRLMDVDMLFRRGMVYSAAAMAIAAIYFGLIALAAALVHLRAPGLGPAAWVLAIVITALLFEPLKNYLQSRLDRLFYRDRYDFRRGLRAFARQLSAEPELGPLIAKVVERLAATLAVPRVAVFLLEEATGGPAFRLAGERGLREVAAAATADALRFLPARLEDYPGGRLVFENPAQAPLPEEQWRAAAALDLHYFLPCVARGRVVAVLGLGRTATGEYLSSEDLELTESLAGYLAIALENARLYAALRRQASELETLKEFSENIVESIAVGVAAVSPEDRIERWNTQMEVLTALPRAAALGRTIAETLGPEFAAEYYSARGDLGAAHRARVRLALGRGGERSVQIAVAPLLTRRFDIVGRIILVDDVTERVALEGKLAQAEKLGSIGLLAAGVAHEVNTPLAVISNYTQLLGKQMPADDPRAALVERITRQTFRASEIVSSLLNFARTGGSPLPALDLAPVIREALALVGHALRARGVEVITDLAPDLPPIAGHPGRLQQVFLNLALNARDAMPRGGSLRVTAAAEAEFVRVEFRDTGAGIAPELRHRIFDPFFTTKTPDRSRPIAAPPTDADRAGAWVENSPISGTGLGLSVSYGIIQEHGGTISVSGEPGQGACFELRFPRARAAALSVAAPAEVGSGGQGVFDSSVRSGPAGFDSAPAPKRQVHA